MERNSQGLDLVGILGGSALKFMHVVEQLKRSLLYSSSTLVFFVGYEEIILSITRCYSAYYTLVLHRNIPRPFIFPGLGGRIFLWII